MTPGSIFNQLSRAYFFLIPHVWCSSWHLYISVYFENSTQWPYLLLAKSKNEGWITKLWIVIIYMFSVPINKCIPFSHVSFLSQNYQAMKLKRDWIVCHSITNSVKKFVYVSKIVYGSAKDSTYMKICTNKVLPRVYQEVLRL